MFIFNNFKTPEIYGPNQIDPGQISLPGKKMSTFAISENH